MALFRQLILLALAVFSMTIAAQTPSSSNGLITLKSNHTVTETADRFEAAVKEKGLSFFTRIDHSANALSADLELNPTQVILFGNPQAGTPLMKCAPTVAIDLPQKALFWADDNGDTWLSYNDPAYLQERHNVDGCGAILEKVTGLLNKLATVATK